MKRILAAVTAACVLGSSGHAAQWQESIARGMPTFTASEGGGSVVLVCDPDRVFNPDRSNASFVVTMPKDKSGSQIVFLAGTGQQAAFAVRDGVATQADSDVEAWTKLIDMIRSGGSIAVVTARDSFVLEMDAVADINCL